jgi:hypothetical protein
MIDPTEATFTATIAFDDDVPIGARLVEAGLVTPEQLDWALTVQERTGSRLGQILMAEGIVDRLDFYRVLARRWRSGGRSCNGTDLLAPRMTEIYAAASTTGSPRRLIGT